MPRIKVPDPQGDWIVSQADAIALMRHRALSRGGCYLNDRYALDDFFALHWAVETTERINATCLHGRLIRIENNEKTPTDHR